MLQILKMGGKSRRKCFFNFVFFAPRRRVYFSHLSLTHTYFFPPSPPTPSATASPRPHGPSTRPPPPPGRSLRVSGPRGGGLRLLPDDGTAAAAGAVNDAAVAVAVAPRAVEAAARREGRDAARRGLWRPLRRPLRERRRVVRGEERRRRV